MSDLQTIDQVSARSGLSKPTLRYYEQVGLIEPPERDSATGHRRYTHDQVDVIGVLANLRTTGLSVADMRQYLEQRRKGDAAALELVSIFKAQSEKLKEEIAKLHSRQAYLKFKTDYWTARARGDYAAADKLAEKFTDLLSKLK